LARLVATPPSGSLDIQALSPASDIQLALQAAMVTAGDVRQFGAALSRLLAFIEAKQPTLSDYDRGRFWHLKGVAMWRLDDIPYLASRALNRSVGLLQGTGTPQALAYLGRVFDTFGQLLHYQGLLRDARLELERAMHYKQLSHDRESTALTLGNLGRLCMELGDFTAAARYLQRDLRIVSARPETETSRIRSQLLSHLGTCALERSRRQHGAQQHTALQAAHDYFMQSSRLAQANHDVYSLGFATLGLGQVAFRRGDHAEARRRAQTAHKLVQTLALPPALTQGMSGLICQLLAEVNLAQGHTKQAIRHFRAARACFQGASNMSPVETAQLLYGFASARRANGQPQQAALLLREALQCLDATEADRLRARIEQALRQDFRESWLLHTTGRFIGQQHIDFLLGHAGHGGFRGETQDVVILFADIRGFTSLSERFAAAPDAFIALLNDYLGHMTRCVERCGGMVDKFIGDAVMAVFSLPTPRPDADAEQAVLAALMMRDELERFNRNLPAGMPHLAMGVGLHRGPVLAGLIGTPQRRSYTVIGDAVNTASRLESLTKHLGASILISEDVCERLPHPERFLLRPLGRYHLKGKAIGVAVADVMGEDDGSRFARVMYAEITHARKALEQLQGGLFIEASRAFATLAAAANKAGATVRATGYQFLADTAEACRTRPPTRWDGTITMEEK
jgi:class 3 adenylate cyclase/tetratricopeptide (TPR) repeat protein